MLIHKIFISILMKISWWIKDFNKSNIHLQFIHIAMIIQEQDYFLLVGRYQLIYVAIMQACGSNIITIYCLNIISGIIILHKIFLPTMDKMFQYFVSGIPWVIINYVQNIEPHYCTSKLTVLCNNQYFILLVLRFEHEILSFDKVYHVLGARTKTIHAWNECFYLIILLK